MNMNGLTTKSPDSTEMSSRDIRKIFEKPLEHEEELEFEGLVLRDFEIDMNDDRWFNTEKSKEEVKSVCERNDEGALVMKPCVYTNYIQFKVEPPKGAAKECTCNDCWNNFWIPPFQSPVECPFCHTASINIATQEYLNNS